MNGRASGAIITDQSRAMKNAIARVFPKTRHRYCLWHIMKKLLEKFTKYEQYADIKRSLHTCLYDSQTIEKFIGKF
jgi:transposase-like protein